MKVIVASTIVPFIEGGGTFIVDWLEEMLQEYGHEVDVLRIPFVSHYPDMPGQMLALRLLDIANHGDRLITIRTPSYLLRHPNKVLWFIHHHRGAYDLWGTPYQDVPDTREGRAYRRGIVQSDHVAFREARHIYTNSAVVSKRLKDFNHVDSEVLYPPVLKPQRFYARDYGDYILYISRLADHKRQALAVEAMRYTKTAVKLLVAGKADEPVYEQKVRAVIEKHGLHNKVTMDIAWHPEERKIEYLADCLAAIYIPFDEDSYGYPSLEAHHARKAVISTTDAGGTSELIIDGINGLLAEPDPRAIAALMDRLYLNRKLAREMGENGETRIRQLGVTWDRVMDKLLA